MSYPNEEVNGTDPSPLVSVPCLIGGASIVLLVGSLEILD